MSTLRDLRLKTKASVNTDFVLIEEGKDDEGNPMVLYALRSNEETLKKYPYRFRLEIGYRLICTIGIKLLLSGEYFTP